MDRIDLICQVEAVPAIELVGSDQRRRTPTEQVRERVLVARERQRERLLGSGALCNGDMDGRMTRRQVPLDSELLERLLADPDAARPQRTRARPRPARGAHVADLDGRDQVQTRDLDEALSYRLDGWERVAA